MANEVRGTIRFRISFAGYTRTKYVRGSRRPARMYITKISWETPDSGYRIAKLWYNVGADKALTFSKFAADEVAKQLRGPWRYIDVQVEPTEAK